ncbi:hypothetical protein Trydic_g15482 [Trypoxylus dichotomus]
MARFSLEAVSLKNFLFNLSRISFGSTALEKALSVVSVMAYVWGLSKRLDKIGYVTFGIFSDLLVPGSSKLLEDGEPSTENHSVALKTA